MIRITELPSGVLLIQTSSEKQYECEVDKLESWVRSKLHMLRATDAGIKIKGVGHHVSDKLFWIYEADDATGNFEPDISLLADRFGSEKVDRVITAKFFNPH